ncbi:HIR complex subunit [Rhizina undulata]
MHFIRPEWLSHRAGDRLCEVYSCHVSPDGKRLATGGLDGNVRIWSTEAIYKSADLNSTLPKQLCSLSHHSGAVHTVRFSGNNRFLASGSDDKIVLVYERDQAATAPRPVFGSNETPHTETWRTYRRLAGHDNDVQDVGWSADSSILVSVGLDSKVVIWSGTTFERLKRIDVHQSHVKGLTFDPANKYFATASDDRSIKIFRFASPAANASVQDQQTNFTLETSIVAPFKDSPLSTYFRRCSWSPDGSHIAAANAVNGPVSSVAIINRGNWDSEINLIGHEGPVEVCAFAPRMFSKTAITPGQQSSPVTVIACAGQDRALSIWNTSNPRPLIITQDIAERPITDLAWTPDGRTLFSSSQDGTISCLRFDEGDLGYVLGVEENERILQKFGAGRKGATLPEGTESFRLEELSRGGERRELEGRMGELMMDGQNPAPGLSNDATMGGTGTNPVQLQPPPPAEAAQPAEKEKPYKQKVTITKDGKKRVAPLLVSTGGGHRSNLPDVQLLKASASGANVNDTDPKTTLDLARPYDGLPKGGMPALLIGNKRKAPVVEEGEQEPPQTNGKRIAVVSSGVRDVLDETPDFIRPAVVSPALTVSQVRLAVPKIRSAVTRVIDPTGEPSPNVPSAGSGPITLGAGDVVFEARNTRSGSDKEPTRLTILKQGQVLWMGYLQKPVLLVTGNNNFWAAACEDGTIYVYSVVGRMMLSGLVLEAQPCFLECKGWWLMCITAVGMAHVWNIKTQKAAHPPVSLAPILDSANTYTRADGPSKADTVTSASINSAGQLILSLSNGDGFAYSKDLVIWQKLSEAWYAVGSQYWDTTPSRTDSVSDPNHPSLSAGVIPHLERRTTTEVIMHGRGRFLQRIVKQVLNREGFEGFETAVSVAHLENRMAAAALLGARDEFKSYLFMYARRIAAEGMKAKVEELCRDLMGRLDQVEDEDEDEEGDDKLVGWEKRELLRGVVVAIGKHRDLQRIVVPYARILGVMEEDLK